MFKTIISTLILSLLTSCSGLKTSSNINNRSISSIETGKLLEDIENYCSKEAFEKIINIGTGAMFMEITTDKFLVTNRNKIIIVDKSNCQNIQIDLNQNEFITNTHLRNENLFIKTLKGSLYKISVNTPTNLEKINLDFPVNSYEFIEDDMNLYNSNSKGRFCTFLELEKEEGLRDHSCKLVEKTIKIK